MDEMKIEFLEANDRVLKTEEIKSPRHREYITTIDEIMKFSDSPTKDGVFLKVKDGFHSYVLDVYDHESRVYLCAHVCACPISHLCMLMVLLMRIHTGMRVFVFMFLLQNINHLYHNHMQRFPHICPNRLLSQAAARLH